MAINPHDDYEKLAKLLYPSIEASGNVYYGQTRKLTMDEVLDKNDLGFESHIENITTSFYNETDEDIHLIDIPHFCWKLGPLKGSFRFTPGGSTVYHSQLNNYNLEIVNFYEDEPNYDVEVITSQYIPQPYYFNNNTHKWCICISALTSYLYGTLFAKYKITKSTNAVSNTTLSGDYASYECSLNATLVSMCFTAGFDPVNKSNYDINNRNFFIDDKNDFLYIKVYKYSHEYDYEYYYTLPMYKPLTLTAVDAPDGLSVIIHSAVEDPNSSDNPGRPPIIIYRINNESWSELEYDNNIGYDSNWECYCLNSLNKVLYTGDSIQLALLWQGNVQLNSIMLDQIGDGFFEASGDASSMLGITAAFDDVTLEEFIDQYSEYVINNIKLSSVYDYIALADRYTHDDGMDYSLSYLFENDTILHTAPYIGQFNYNSNISYMYSGCTSLTSVKPISPTGAINATSAFLNCTSLESGPDIRCYVGLRYIDQHTFALTDNYAGCNSLKDIYLNYSNLFLENEVYVLDDQEWLSNVPDECRVHAKYSVYVSDDSIRSNFNLGNRPIIRHDLQDYLPFTVMCDGLYKEGFLVTSGCDNTSLDFENATLDTYNYDGSYNQSIYGYKEFKGPVNFVGPVNFDGNISGIDYMLESDSETVDGITYRGFAMKSHISKVSLLTSVNGEMCKIKNGTASIVITSSIDDSSNKIIIDADEVVINGHTFTKN